MAESKSTPPSTAFAITSMVTGIVGLVMAAFPVVGFLLSVVAIVFGALSLKKPTGKGMAIAGLVTGIVGVVIGFFFLLYLLFAFSYNGYY